MFERWINSYFNSWQTCHLTAFGPSRAAPCTSGPSHPWISAIKPQTLLPNGTTTPPDRQPLRLRFHRIPRPYQIADCILSCSLRRRKLEWVPCVYSRHPCSRPVRVQRAAARTQTAGNWLSSLLSTPVCTFLRGANYYQNSTQHSLILIWGFLLSPCSQTPLWRPWLCPSSDQCAQDRLVSVSYSLCLFLIYIIIMMMMIGATRWCSG